MDNYFKKVFIYGTNEENIEAKKALKRILNKLNIKYRYIEEDIEIYERYSILIVFIDTLSTEAMCSIIRLSELVTYVEKNMSPSEAFDLLFSEKQNVKAYEMMHQKKFKEEQNMKRKEEIILDNQVEKITITLEEYKELLQIKGKYEELKSKEPEFYKEQPLYYPKKAIKKDEIGCKITTL